MGEVARPHQRVWFRPYPRLNRSELSDRVAGLLLRSLPDDAGIEAFVLYPAGEGWSDDPRVVTFGWRLVYEVEASRGRDLDWGHAESERLATCIREQFSADRTLERTAAELGGDWTSDDVGCAVDELAERGLQLDPRIEAPPTLAAVIMASDLRPRSLGSG